jgi:hypothetical protein
VPVGDDVKVCSQQISRPDLQNRIRHVLVAEIPTRSWGREGAFAAENCVEDGKWLMKTYSSGDQALSTMPDVSTLTYIGQAYVPTINFDSDVKFQQAIPGTPSDRFAATYRGRFEVRTAGSYTFCTTSDDGSDLTIDGSLVVDNGGLHASRRRSPWRSGSACAWDRDAGVDHEVAHGKALLTRATARSRVFRVIAELRRGVFVCVWGGGGGVARTRTIRVAKTTPLSK